MTLLQGAGTGMALYFYAMLCVLCLKDILIKTVHFAEIKKIKLNKRVMVVMVVVRDTKNDKFSVLFESPVTTILTPIFHTPTRSEAKKDNCSVCVFLSFYKCRNLYRLVKL